MRAAAGVAAIVGLVWSTAVAAKGYSAHPDASNQSDQQIKKRLSQMEEKQQAMQDAMTTEFQKLRAEVASIRDQSAMKASMSTAK